MDQNWDVTLIQTIPEIVKASNALEYHLAMRIFTAKINDSHAVFASATFSSWRGKYETPFLARFLDEKIVITKVAPSISELHQGDVIKKIDGCDINHLRDSLRKYSFGSNTISVEKRLIDLILRGQPNLFSITVMNETGEHTLDLFRGDYYDVLNKDETPHWKVSTLNECRFGIVNARNLMEYHFPQIIDEIKTVDAIILDLRYMPRRPIFDLDQYMIESPNFFARYTNPDVYYPGTFYWEKIEYYYENFYPLIQKPVTILFDERTLSSAEFYCMILERIPSSMKIGSTTAGADGTAYYIYLPGGIITSATLAGIYYPDYTPTQRVGIVPHYYVYPTIQGIREGRDEVMEFALNCAFVGVADIAKKEEMKIYPNPTTGEFRVTSSELRVTGVEVFEVFGRKVQTEGKKEKNEREIVMNISHLPLGIYIVKVITNESIITQKIIKN
jgi:hypothetical protein